MPCAPVNDVRQALADEQVLARDMIVEVDHPEFGTLKEVRSPIRTDRRGARAAPGAPSSARTRDAILGEILGYGAAHHRGACATGGSSDE